MKQSLLEKLILTLGQVEQHNTVVPGCSEAHPELRVL